MSVSCTVVSLPCSTYKVLSEHEKSQSVEEVDPSSPLLMVQRLSFSLLPSNASSLDVISEHALRSSIRAELRSNSEIQDVHLYPPASRGSLSEHKHMYSYLRRTPSCALLSI